jgi:hypothetical protein
MQTIGTILGTVGGLTCLVCHILVIIKMFQRGQTGLGIACILLTLCFGIGGLITLIYGWVKASEWNIKNLMVVYTIGFGLNVIGTIIAPPDFSAYMKQVQVQQ